jgi:hypothetical protein
MVVCTCLHMSRCGVVGIATAYRLNDRGVAIRVSVRSRILSSPYHANRLWGQGGDLYTHSPTLHGVVLN